MSRSSQNAPSTASSRKERSPAASTVAWELCLNRARMKLKEKPKSSDGRGPEVLEKNPSLSTVFTRAGLRWSKAAWMRRQPDLRMSVICRLARALEVEPVEFFAEILKEQGRGETVAERRRAKKFAVSAQHRAQTVAILAKAREKAERRQAQKRRKLTREVAR